MHTVGHHMTFQNLAFFLPSQRMENCPEGPPSLLKHNFSPLFGDKHNMGFAIPFGWDKL
jgi:hypothetical protein